MALYFDTSALMPYYRQEASSEHVQRLLERQREPVLISHLSQVEFASVLARWVRMKDLTEAHANSIEAAFQQDLDEGRFVVKILTRGHFQRAYRWLLARKTALRTLDALHLACAAGYDAMFVSLDDVQCAAADFVGLNVLQPK